jgi:hypothetical protein
VAAYGFLSCVAGNIYRLCKKLVEITEASHSEDRQEHVLLRVFIPKIYHELNKQAAICTSANKKSRRMETLNSIKL